MYKRQAGPLQVRGDYASGSYYIPLATTEGALVASVNRGCSAITRSGGALSFIVHDGMARAPVLKARNIAHARDALDFINHNRARVKEIAESTSRFLTLADIQSWLIGRNLFMRFVQATSLVTIQYCLQA